PLYINGPIWDKPHVDRLRLEVCPRAYGPDDRRPASGPGASRLARRSRGLTSTFRRRSCAGPLCPRLWFSSSGPSRRSPPPPAPDALLPPGAKLELLYTRSAPIKGGLTEGVAAAPDGTMYFSEIPFGEDKGMIMRFDPRTRMTTVFTPDSHKSNGLMFDAQG